MIVVGQTQRLGVWAHHVAPRLYDRLVGPVVDLGALRNTATDKGCVLLGWRKGYPRRTPLHQAVDRDRRTVTGLHTGLRREYVAWLDQPEHAMGG